MSIGEWQRAQQYAIDNAEYGCIRADAESQSGNGDNRKARVLTQTSQRKPKVTPRIVQPNKRVLITIGFLQLINSTKCASGSAAGLFDCHALLNKSVFEARQMFMYFVVKLLLKTFPAKYAKG